LTVVTAYEQLRDTLRSEPRTWVVTGAAGFIGSHLVEHLLGLGQNVVGLDNFATGHRHNVESVIREAGANAGRYRFLEGDIRDLDTCLEGFAGSDILLHQAALGSVPRSIEDPIATNQSNIDGFLNVLVAARDLGIRRVVYAASSSTYGDHPGLPKVEDRIGKPLSPYAVTKYVNELYASVFGSLYGMELIGLRYFNVFGPRQDPNGAYAAVIPRWIGRLLSGQPCVINGDGETSRDFCYVENVVQANLLAAMVTGSAAIDQVFNVAVGKRTSLNELYRLIRDELARFRADLAEVEAVHWEFRKGDVRHSLADVSKARNLLGYEPTHDLAEGMRASLKWYLEKADLAATVAAE
jgi:UDP-N-acetylglucosamine/UDP-N-acetylgalactosamine 4-epimerase